MPCTNCMAKYTVLKKEHGCSNCGYGFCQRCLARKFLLPRLSAKPVPVCDSCYKSLTGETVQPLEKSRGESSDTNDGKWWGDDKPPPSMRHFYPVKSKLLNKKDTTKSDAENDAQIVERLAKVMNKSVDEIKNPRYIVSDRDEGDIPSSSTDILSNLRQPFDPATLLTNKGNVNNDEQIFNLPKPPPDADSIEGLQARLAALRNVPVEMIRKPRLMVMNDNDEDSEPELNDDAKNLLEKAEQKLRKTEPDLFYENEALDSD